MRFRFYVFLAICVFGSLTTSAQSVAQLFNCNDNFYTVKFSDRDLIQTPLWNPEKDDNPPLSARKAVEVARTNLNQCVSGASEKWSLSSIELKPFGTDRWIYEIEFDCPSAACRDEKSRSFKISIKLDGAALLPRPGSQPTPKLDTSDHPIQSN